MSEDPPEGQPSVSRRRRASSVARFGEEALAAQLAGAREVHNAGLARHWSQAVNYFPPLVFDPAAPGYHPWWWSRTHRVPPKGLPVFLHLDKHRDKPLWPGGPTPREMAEWSERGEGEEHGEDGARCGEPEPGDG